MPTGNAWAVSLGDSYISGEAGRWAGNSNSSSQTDALGSTAYYDAGTGESIVGCHRSKSAEIAFGTISSKNLACSGAKTATSPYASSNDFKPGLDFYNDGAGHIGQALALQNFAATNRVTMVAHLHRRQRLQLRLDRAVLRHGLPDLADLVEGLLQGRLAP